MAAFDGNAFDSNAFDTDQSGVSAHRRVRVRRADFSSQANYEYALRAALLEANFAIRPEDASAPIREKAKAQKTRYKAKGDVSPRLPDTAIPVSAESMAKLQAARDMEEAEMLIAFIKIIEAEY